MQNPDARAFTALCRPKSSLSTGSLVEGRRESGKKKNEKRKTEEKREMRRVHAPTPTRPPLGEFTLFQFLLDLLTNHSQKSQVQSFLLNKITLYLSQATGKTVLILSRRHVLDICIARTNKLEGQKARWNWNKKYKNAPYHRLTAFDKERDSYVWRSPNKNENILRPFWKTITLLMTLNGTILTVLASGKTDYHCKVKETLFIQDLEPALNVNVSSEKLLLY